MNDAQPIVVMTYQEKLWWDFIESNPEMVLWFFYIMGGLLTLILIWPFIKAMIPRRNKKNW